MVFHTPSEMSKKGIRVTYAEAEFMSLMKIFKGTVDMNLDILDKCEMPVVLLDF